MLDKADYEHHGKPLFDSESHVNRDRRIRKEACKGELEKLTHSVRMQGIVDEEDFLKLCDVIEELIEEI